jgi:hypothetical protein
MAASIASVTQLVAVIQTQLARRADAPVRRTAREPARRTGSRYTQEKLGALIEKRVGEIGRDDPQAGAKAFRVFVEAVLLSQLGEALINDPRFYQMVDQVQHLLETDETTRTLAAKATAELLNQAGKVEKE